ncbi:MAG: glycoside hydrolase family 43 protein [Acidobacteriota bacterium]
MRIGLVLALAVSAAAIEPGKVWLDTSGKPIQAHSAGILLKDGVYYWYGEDKTLGNFNQTGISCYSSRNLREWTRQGTALPKDALPPQFRDQGICERAKVLFNKKTGKYVMWMHLDSKDYTVASAGVAVADRPAGPFRFLGYKRPVKYDFGYPEKDRTRQSQLGGTYRDMNLFLDDDGRAYAFYASEDNWTMYVVRLNEEFTAAEEPAVLGKTWSRILVRKMREAPAPFKYKGKYYLITSGCTGWAPNAADYAVADHVLGPYEMRGSPMRGPDADKTFFAQSTYVIPAPGKPAGSFIFLADRWNARRLEDSRYVWLPFTMKPDGTFTIEWLDRWEP